MTRFLGTPDDAPVDHYSPHGLTATAPAGGAGRLVAGLFLAAGIAALPGAAARAGDFEDARLLAAQCAQCHGTDGVSAGGIDSLAGKEYNDLRDKMLDMSRPGETGDIMKHQAKGYTPEQIDLIAWYFSQLPKPGDGTGGGGGDGGGDDEPKNKGKGGGKRR